MDFGTTILGLVILALFILPVIFIARSGKGKGKKFHKDFFTEASLNKLKISEKDFWNEYALGIDTTQNKIIYLDWSGPERVNIIIDLKEVKVFEPLPGYMEQNKKNFSYKKVERLGLRFHLIDPDKPDVNINFFIAGFGQITDDEIKLFKKWLAIIKGQMDSNTIDNLKHSA